MILQLASIEFAIRLFLSRFFFASGVGNNSFLTASLLRGSSRYFVVISETFVKIAAIFTIFHHGNFSDFSSNLDN